MQLVEIDDVGTEAAQLLFEGRGQPRALEGILGGDDPAAAAGTHELADDRLGVPVDHCRVDEIATEFLGAREREACIAGIDCTVGFATDGPGTKPEFGHLESRRTEAPIGHLSHVCDNLRGARRQRRIRVPALTPAPPVLDHPRSRERPHCPRDQRCTSGEHCVLTLRHLSAPARRRT